MSRAAQRARMEVYAAKELLGVEWLQSAIITEQVVDMSDPVRFPNMAKAREHAARLRELEARHVG